MEEHNARMLWIDHVVLACADLDVAAAHLLERHGLASVPGGRHPGWGTANRIVPLGGSYVELITVVDAEEALQSQFGKVSKKVSAISVPTSLICFSRATCG